MFKVIVCLCKNTGIQPLIFSGFFLLLFSICFPLRWFSWSSVFFPPQSTWYWQTTNFSLPFPNLQILMVPYYYSLCERENPTRTNRLFTKTGTKCRTAFTVVLVHTRLLNTSVTTYSNADGVALFPVHWNFSHIATWACFLSRSGSALIFSYTRLPVKNSF